MSVIITVIVLVVVILVLYLRLRFCHAGRLLARIPGPKAWPIFGNMFKVMISAEELFLLPRAMFREYGNICKLDGFGIRTVHIFSRDDVETLLSTTKFNQKQDPYTFLKPWLREGLLISNGKKWQQRRKLLTPAFHFNILKKYTHRFNEQTKELLSKIEKTVEDEIDLLPLISNATLNIMCQTSMGTSLNDNKDAVVIGYFKALNFLGNTLVHRFTRVWLHNEFIFLFSKIFTMQKKAIASLHELTSRIIRERKMYFKNKVTTKYTADNNVYGVKGSFAMLDLLIQKEREGQLDFEGIREEVDTFMFEGHDTTAMALNFLIMRIANEPQVQSRLHEEIINIFGNSDHSPTMEDLNNMKYLECCIKESLRLYPSVPFIARFATEDVFLSGYKVPAGTQCHIHVYDVHRRGDYFPDPEKFIPERFLPENSVRRHPYSYVPFSAGPRNCIGQKFAMLEMKTIISGLVRRFQLERVTRPENIIFKADIVLRATNPLYVRLRSRLK